jgi:hypothetical protein
VDFVTAVNPVPVAGISIAAIGNRTPRSTDHLGLNGNALGGR